MNPKLILIYDPVNGEAIPDGECEGTAKTLIENKVKIEFTFSTFLFLEAFRVQVKNGLIKPEEFEVIFGNEIIGINEKGTVSHWPNGFGDHMEKFLTQLIDWELNPNHI